MPVQRKLTERTKGMFAGQATDMMQYIDGGLYATSGTKPYTIPKGPVDLGGVTHGEQTPSNFAFNLWPYIVSGQTEYDPSALQTGSNLSAVQPFAQAVAQDAGFDGVTGNPSGLNGMPSNI